MKGEHYVRMAAARALASMGAEAKPAVPDLIPMLKSPGIRPWAARILGAIGPEARAAVPALVEALKDQHPSGAAIFGSALLRIDPSQRGVVEARLAAIEPSWKTRYFRAFLSAALGRRSPEADEYTLQTLRALNLTLTEWDKATAVAEQIGEYDIERYLHGVEDSFGLLADLGAGAAEAIPRLKELTHHADPRIQRLAVTTLKRIDKESGP
jgi:HEAT repeat protein